MPVNTFEFILQRFPEYHSALSTSEQSLRKSGYAAAFELYEQAQRAARCQDTETLRKVAGVVEAALGSGDEYLETVFSIDFVEMLARDRDEACSATILATLGPLASSDYLTKL